MSRVRLLRSADLDLDALAHLRALRGRAGVRELPPVDPHWSLIARSGLMLGSGGPGERLLTLGDAALAAAAIRWRGPILHVPIGTPTRRECRLLSGRLRRATVATTTRTAASLLRRAGIAPTRLTHVAADRTDGVPTRAAARQRLGIEPNATVVHLPGAVRSESGHRLMLWAVAILAVRDPSWHFLVDDRGDAGHAARFIESTTPGGRARVAYGVDDRVLAAAADVSVFATNGVAERSAIDLARSLGHRIVGTRSLWQREALPADVGTFIAPLAKPRAIARAILDAAEATTPVPPRTAGTEPRLDEVVFTDAPTLVC